MFARKALDVSRKFGQKAVLEGARTFGRKITSVAQIRGGQIQDITGKIAGHTDLLGLDAVSKGLRAVGNTAGEVKNIARYLDENKPRQAIDRALKLIDKDY